MTSRDALAAIGAMSLFIIAIQALRHTFARIRAYRATDRLARSRWSRDTAHRANPRPPWEAFVAGVLIGFGCVASAYADCPAEGDGGDPVLNAAKNRTDKPATPAAMDVEQIRRLPTVHTRSPRARWSTAQRRLVLDMEGRGVVVVGYLAGVKEEGPESANCHGDGRDFHLYLTAGPRDDKAASIIIEITPRQHAPAWTLAALRRLVKQHTEVRVTGWLLYDQEHGSEVGKSRGTVWELHPITGIEVLDGIRWVAVGGGQ